MMDPVLLRGIPDGIYLNSNFSQTFSFFGIIFFGFSKNEDVIYSTVYFWKLTFLLQCYAVQQLS